MTATAGTDPHYESTASPLDLGPLPRPTQMPINPTERRWRMHRGARTLSGCALDALYNAKESAGRMFRQARDRASDGYSRLSQRTDELARDTRYAARYAQERYPMRVLGVIAVSAFALGMGIRFWRSR